MKNRVVALLLALLLILSLASYAEELPQVVDEPLHRIRIRAVGDLMVHQAQLDIAKQSDGSYDFDPQYALVKDVLADADYTIGNLETTVGLYGKNGYSGYPRFNVPEALLDTLKDCGFDFLTMANNHMLDRYFDGMVTTVNNVEAYGFDHGGAYRSQEEANAPIVVDVNGIKLGMLCYTAHTNAMEKHSDEKATQFGIDYLYKADFAADVQKVRDAGADIVIAMPHWGTEYKRQPDSNVRSTAKKMIAAGVDVILGSHPHMVQPLEWLTVDSPTGTRTGLVAWSMGNFISNMKVQYTDSGIIVEFCVVEKDDGTYAVTDVNWIPIYCWRRDDMIQAVCSGDYLDSTPAGMNTKTYNRMKTSCKELVNLIGMDPFKGIPH